MTDQVAAPRERNWVALDAGGTMTDAVIVSAQGEFGVGKYLTNKQDESISFIGSIADAAKLRGQELSYVLPHSEVIVYAGTIMLNTLLSKTGSNVGLLLTQGFEDYLLMEKAEGGWLGYPYADRLHTVTHHHDDPVIPRDRVYGVQGRIDLFGQVAVPLREDDVRAAARELAAAGVEAIGVMFLFSHMNPEHEQRAAKIIAEEAPGVSVVLSSAMAPTHKEYTRLASVVAQSYAGERARKHFRSVEAKAREDGFNREVSTLLAHGGTVPVDTPRLYESYVSGPVGGVLGGHYIGEIIGSDNVVCCDIGGTSFDVGIVRDGTIPITREPTLLSFRTNIPMIHTESIGAGMGSELGIHPLTGKLTIGPRSAGSDVGRCLNWPNPTITDCHLLLGYLDPNNFLGGDVPLDPDAARAALEPMAKHFKTDVLEFCERAHQLVTESMREFLANMLRGRGYTTQEYSMLMYGGGGPLGLSGVVDGLDFKEIITFPFAAVFSAFGVLCAPRRYRYHQATIAACPAGDDDPSRAVKGAAVEAINAAWASLEERARADFALHGWDFDSATLTRSAYVRFTNQLSDFEVPWDGERLESIEDLHELMRSYERVYTSIYPKQALYSEVGYQILELALSADLATPKPAVPILELRGRTPPSSAVKGRRPGHWRGTDITFDIYEMDELQAGNVINGPAVIEHPATTLLIPPTHHVEFDSRRLIHYRAGLA
ncbi:hydantoinase/oxoprolinase family protein [Pseudonocardia hispaniensis]|uniref:Hydantoinase/oxoprolinase family protein n=1 Tax=Pseudonocardia hispaniensis TaxID=904933 RepID=A0ABW1J7Q4_9PSEU